MSFLLSSDAYIPLAVANPSVNLNGRTYDPNDNTLLSALLLYHLLPGNWSQDSPDFTSRIDYPVPTTLNGHNVTNLESGTHQVMSCSRGADNTFIVNNQAQTPKIVAAYSTSYLIIYEVDAIIGFPPSYSVLTSSLGLNGVDALRAAASVSSLDSAEGYTLFAPQDAAFGFGISPSNITDPAKVWSNHVGLAFPSAHEHCLIVLAGHHGPDGVLDQVHLAGVHFGVGLQIHAGWLWH